jgi:CMP-N-acetylneuraminic acid synthetase|tara:strand:- start:144 stop:821 length:678 start_codon:yes stop_codon:yes gene_type:complete
MIAGKPVVLWVMLAALESGVFDEIILTSEDDEILDLAPVGVRVWKRSAELSGDEVSADDPAVDVVQKMNRYYRGDTAVCLLTACVPTTTAELVQATAEVYERERPSKLVMLKLADHPHHMAVPLDNDDPTRGLRRFTEFGAGEESNALPRVYVPAGNLIWGSFADFRDENPKLVGGNYSEDTYGYLVPDELAIDIDTPFDFKVAELLLNQRRASSALAYTGADPD